MHRILLTIVAFLCASVVSAAVPFWGAKESQPVDTAPDRLKPGQFIWNPGVAPTGPIVVLVSIDEQRGYVYRNGIEIGVTTVSTGKPGHETPTGVFTVLQKDKDHHSSIYNDAAMPYQERLTWGGVALHAGGLPGYPESHGCIHLPSQLAADLFGVSPMGMTVVVVRTRQRRPRSRIQAPSRRSIPRAASSMKTVASQSANSSDGPRRRRPWGQFLH